MYVPGMYVTHKTQSFPGGKTTATIVTDGTLYRVRAMVQFDSGNYLSECDKGGLSLVAAEGLVAYYTTRYGA